MTPDEQLAAIRERHEQSCQWTREKHAEVSPGEPYSESGWCPMDMSLADVSALLNHIAAVTAERDEAEANIGEVNQLLADTLSRTKSAEQRAADAARVERDAVVAWLREAEKSWRKLARNVADGDEEIRADGIADGNRYAADAIERGEHEKGGGDG